MHTHIQLGAEFKAYIKLDSVAGMTMDDYNFYAEYYCYPNNKVKVEKHDMIRKGENEYWACLNSKDIGVGPLKCCVVRHIPDADFPDGVREDMEVFDMHIHIVK